MPNQLRDFFSHLLTRPLPQLGRTLHCGDDCAIIVSPRIGDVIFCTPAIHLLKTWIDSGRIEVIALSAAAASVFENNPAIDRVWIKPSRAELACIGKRVTCTLDFHRNKQTTAVARSIGRPLFQSSRSRPGIHQSQIATDFVRNLLDNDISEPAPGYCLYHTAAHDARAREILLAAGATLNDDEILIGCHLGTYSYSLRAASLFKRRHFSKKSWPQEHFLRLAELLLTSNPKIRLVLTGSSSESALGEPFAANPSGIVNLIGKTSVLELKACMLRFRAFVVADTGPLHVASSTTCPIIYLSSDATSAANTGPYPEKPWHYRIHRNTMANIEPQEVFAQIITLLRLAQPTAGTST